MLPLAWWWGIATNGNILTKRCYQRIPIIIFASHESDKHNKQPYLGL